MRPPARRLHTEQTNHRMPKVIALGDVNMDIIAHLRRYPAHGEDGLAEAASIQSGGSAANTALTLARLGVEVGLIARVGHDVLAEQALADLAAAGVNLEAVQRDTDAMTGVMFVAVTPDGERTMFGWRGANPNTDPALLDAETIAQARLLHLSGYALLTEPQRSAALRGVDIARRGECAISFDPGLEAVLRCRSLVEELLPSVDLLLPNRAEAEALTGCQEPWEMASALLGRGVRSVGLKLGAEGCVIAAEKELVTLPPFGMPVRDTTGAGDAFNAGLVWGWLHGLAWRASGLLANVLGALGTTVCGAGPALPRPDQVRAFLASQMEEGEWREWENEIACLIGALERIL